MNKPNVILIQADQLSASSLGIYGNPIVRTSALDFLASQSVVFENAYCNYPLCVPSRASMMSGQYPSSIGSYDNFIHLNPRVETLPLILKNNGYKTALVGKNHAFTDGAHPDVHGGNRFYHDCEVKEKIRTDELHRIFDVVCDAHHALGVEGYMYDEEILNYWIWILENVWGSRNKTHGINPNTYKASSSYLLGKKAGEVIKESKYDNRPLFMWLSYPDPHTPYQVSEPYASLYETENIPEPIVGSLKNKPERYCNAYKKDVKQYPAENIKKIRSLHYGMINQMDDSIGYVISVLKEYNMWENTIIIFTADHGDSLGDHGLMQKHQFFYDSFTHIPFMIKIPGITSRFTNSLTSLLDILPTILSALNLPELPQAQGTNLLPFLKGEKEDTQPYIVMECGNSGNEEKIIMDRGTKLVKKGGLGVGISIRTTGYKLNVYENDKCELYDLKTDSNELNNLYYNEASKAIVSELSNELLKHTLRIRDNIPVNRGLIDPAANDKRVVRWSPLQRKK